MSEENGKGVLHIQLDGVKMEREREEKRE